MDIHAHENYLANREAAEAAAQIADVEPRYYVEAEQTSQPGDCAVIAVAPGYVARTVEEKTSTMIDDAKSGEGRIRDEIARLAGVLGESVYGDEDLVESLIARLGAESAKAVLDDLSERSYTKPTGSMWINAFTLVNPSNEALHVIGKDVTDMLTVPGTAVLRISAT